MKNNKTKRISILLAVLSLVGLCWFGINKLEQDPPGTTPQGQQTRATPMSTRDYVAFTYDRLIELRSLIYHPDVASDFNQCIQDVNKLVNSKPYQDVVAGIQYPYAQWPPPRQPRERLKFELEWALNQTFSTAFVYLMTGEEEYFEIAKPFMLQFVQIYPYSHAEIDVSHISYYLGMSWDFLKEKFTAEENDLIRTYLTNLMVTYELGLDQEPFGFKDVPKPPYIDDSSWTQHFVGAFAVGAAVLELDNAPGYQPRWFDKSVQQLTNYLNAGWHESGIPHQGIHYSSYGFHYAAWFGAYMERKGIPYFSHPKVKNFPNWIVHEMWPWEKYDVGNWGNTNILHKGVGEMAYSITYHNQDNPNSAYIIDEYRKNINQDILMTPAKIIWRSFNLPTTPAQRGLPTYLYDEGGFLYARSDWTKDAFYLVFRADKGQPQAGHGHADGNTFTLAANGKLFGSEAGFGIKYTVDHTGVLIDGKGQGWYRYPSKIKDFSVSGNEIRVTGDSTLAYKYATHRPYENGYVDYNGIYVKEYNPVINAFRHVIFNKGNYPFAILEDDINKDNTVREYTWQMLTPQYGVAAQINGNFAFLQDVYSGPYALVKGGEDVTVTVNPPANTYKIYALTSKEYWEPWSWSLKLDINGTTYNVTTPAGDHAAFDYVEIPTGGLFLNSPTAIKVRPVGDFKLASVVLVPTNSAIGNPDNIVITHGTMLALNSKWSLGHTGPNRKMLVYFMNDSITLDYKPFMFADNVVSLDPQYNGNNDVWKKLTAKRTDVNGKFRVLLYPHLEGDPLPQVNFDNNGATITLPDGTVKNYTWKLQPPVVEPPPVVDITPPTVSINKPINNSTVKGAKLNMDISNSDNVKVTKLEVRVDGVLRFAYNNPPGTLQPQYDIKSWPKNSSHDILVEAWDAAGNYVSRLVKVKKG